MNYQFNLKVSSKIYYNTESMGFVYISPVKNCQNLKKNVNYKKI